MDVDGEALAALDDELDQGGRLHCIEGPNNDEDGVKTAIAETTEGFGGLSGLVNNAGFTRNGPLEELTLENWNAVIATDLTGGFLCAKHAAPHLR